MAKREREFEKFEVLRKMYYSSQKACYSNFSPLKKSRTCSSFDGQIPDGKACMRVF